MPALYSRLLKNPYVLRGAPGLNGSNMGKEPGYTIVEIIELVREHVAVVHVLP